MADDEFLVSQSAAALGGKFMKQCAAAVQLTTDDAAAPARCVVLMVVVMPCWTGDGDELMTVLLTTDCVDGGTVAH